MQILLYTTTTSISVIIISLITLFFIQRKKWKLEKHYRLLYLDFEILYEEMKQLEKDLTYQREASKQNVPYQIIPVLEIYENSNIRIPVDVLEETIRMTKDLTSDKLIFDYIENQRLYWKHENSKKPYMKVK